LQDASRFRLVSQVFLCASDDPRRPVQRLCACTRRRRLR